MSNDRIDEIIREHINISYKTNLEHIQRIRKAMEQYGKERYEEGVKYCREVCYDVLDPEITRLQLLAKAQKEYIELLADRYAGLLTVAAPHGYQESRESIEKGIKLRVQIKTLEQ